MSGPQGPVEPAKRAEQPIDQEVRIGHVHLRTADIDRTRDFYRFFIAPGMGHCSGGPGPNQFDALTALEQWVEKSAAPEKLLASHSTNGKVDRTRPLCLYPQVARYKGTGGSDDAANFTCVTEAPTTPVRRSTAGAQRN